MCDRNGYKTAVAIAAAALLSACAGPEIDRSAANFDERSYSEDLAECRGGSVAVFVASGFTGAVAGSAIGAMEGAMSGAIHGDSAEGALIGSVVGGVIGMGVGAYDALATQDEELARCLRGKGYAS